MGSSAPVSRAEDPAPEPSTNTLGLPAKSVRARNSRDDPVPLLVRPQTPAFYKHSIPQEKKKISREDEADGADLNDKQAIEPTNEVLKKKTDSSGLEDPASSENPKDHTQLVPNEQERSPEKVVASIEMIPLKNALDKSTARSPVAKIPQSMTDESNREPRKATPQSKNSPNKLPSVDSPVVFSVEKMDGFSNETAKKDKLKSGESREGGDVIEQKVVVSGIGNVEVKPRLLEDEIEKMPEELKNKSEKEHAKSNGKDDGKNRKNVKESKKRRMSARALRWVRRSRRKEGSDLDDSDFVLSDDATEETTGTSETTEQASYSDSTNSFRRIKDLKAMAKENRAKHIPRKAEVKVWKYGRIVWAKIGKYGYWPAMVVTPDSYMWLKKDHSKRRPKDTVTVHFFADGCLADVRMQDVHDFDTNRHLQADEGEDEFASEIEAARIAADLVLKKYGHSYPRKLDRVEEEEIIDGSGIEPQKIGTVEGRQEDATAQTREQTKEKLNEAEGNDAEEVLGMKAMLEKLRSENEKLKEENEIQKDRNTKLQETLNQIRGLMK